ncbi:nuclear transport factor 2 family protein [Streptomyces sp. NPDC005805]|uniref:nuclear transport factor 2 family protein n=1 Tax=Streptomyces sp. NPDC005805 TaxID=3157068 RepID=UPI0033F7D055
MSGQHPRDGIREACESFLDAYGSRDLDRLRGLMSHREDLVVLGTHRDLRFTGWTAFEAALADQFAAMGRMAVRTSGFEASLLAGGRAACAALTVDCDGTVSGNPVRAEGLRITLTLEVRDGTWRIVQLHWSVPQDGSLLRPEECDAPGGGEDPDDIADAFAAYEELARRVTESVNRRRFDFSRDIAPLVAGDFVEIVNGVPYGPDAVRQTFAPLVEAVGGGAAFSWTVALESGRVLTDGTVLLITTARVVLSGRGRPRVDDRYRITNVLRRSPTGQWVFVHQHRSELAESAADVDPADNTGPERAASWARRTGW